MQYAYRGSAGRGDGLVSTQPHRPWGYEEGQNMKQYRCIKSLVLGDRTEDVVRISDGETVGFLSPDVKDRYRKQDADQMRWLAYRYNSTAQPQAFRTKTEAALSLL